MKRLVRALLASILLSTSAFAGWSPGGPFQSFNAMPWFYNQPAPAPAPVNLVLPVITGTTQVGQTLTVTPGAWSNSPSSVTEQWLSGGLPISGATGTTYVPVSGDVGKVISDVETASNTHGSATAVAVPVGPVTGGGSPGFLANTSTLVSMQNLIPGSADLSSATGNWTTVAGGVAGLTSTVASSVTLPDGTTGNVTSLTIPHVTAANTYAVITAAVASNINANPVGFGVWATMQTPGCTIWMTYSAATTFVRVPITYTDGVSWVKVQGNIPPATYTTAQSPAPQIGINRFDVSQSANAAACTVLLTGAYTTKSPYDQLISYSDVKLGGPIATTTAPVSAGISKPLPAHVAFRDFSLLNPVNPMTSPMIPQTTTEVWRGGGLSNPYVSQDFQFGGFYWGFANCTSSAGHGQWLSFCLFKSADGLTGWTEDTANAPYVQVFGSILANPAVSAVGSGFTASATGTATFTGSGCSTPPVIAVTTNSSGQISAATPSPNNGVGTGSCPPGGWPTAAQTTLWSYSGVGAGTGASFTFSSKLGTGTMLDFQLHPAWLPFGCNVSGTAHPFCIVYSTQGSGGIFQTYMAYSASDVIDGIYTPLGCTVNTQCTAPTPVITTQGAQGIPQSLGSYNTISVKNVGGATGINYLYGPAGGLDGTQSSYFSTSANSATTGSGTTWAYQGQVLPPKISGVDWDYASGNGFYQDAFVFLNHCGFYELFGTSYSAAGFGGALGTTQQLVSYAVGASPTGPWYRYQTGPIIPGNSLLWPSPILGGDTAVLEIGGTFIYTGNFDDAVSKSAAVAATMPQGTCPP